MSGASVPYYMQAAILEFLINDLEPIQILDSGTFRCLLKSCGAKQELPNSDYFTNYLLECYIDTRHKVMNIVSNAESVYLKLNIWRSFACDKHMLTVSAQILQSNMKVVSYVLQTTELPESYTHADIRDCLINLLSEWTIPETSIILSADVKEIADMAKVMKCLNVNCLIDSINCAVRECLTKPAIERLLNHARKLVGQFTTDNSTAVTLLQEKQTLLTLPHIKLKLDTASSWVSVYEMLDTLQEQAAAVYAVMKDPLFEADGKDIKLLSASEQTLMQNLIAILKSLVMAVSMVTEMTYPSAAVILPVLKKLESTLKIADVDSQLIVDVKKCLWTNLSEKYSAGDVRDFLLICSVTDPRYKDLKFVDTEDKKRAFELLRQEMKTFSAADDSAATRDSSPQIEFSSDMLIKVEPLDDEVEFVLRSPDQLPSTSVRSPDQLPSSSESASPAKRQKQSPKQKAAFCNWLDDVVHEEIPTGNNEDDAVSMEIARYEKEKQILSFSSPMSWWGERQYIYPLLSQVAKKYLSAPAMVKAYDGRQEILERKQQCIAPDFLEYMLFLNG
ncbi:MAG: hAT transposon family protein, partial [Candidatus Thiodiazotropha sp.]